MTTEDIIRMAQEAGYIGFQFTSITTLERFAKLIAAAEREACAKVAETPVAGEQDDITMEAKDRIATAIRARGQG